MKVLYVGSKINKTDLIIWKIHQ